MQLFWLSLAIATTASASKIPGGGASEACLFLKHAHPENTFLPGDALYAEENEVPWSTNCWLGPKCIFAPNDAMKLSYAVKLFTELRVKFAMRGGGHMPIAAASSIDSGGVLLTSTRLNNLALSADKKTLSVGPGLRWSDVYMRLNGTGLAVVGARLPPVGVPGLLLGGGVSFYSYEYGLASTNGNVKGYECVLADGRVIEVTPNKYADLFWALQGGGNSFCLVTRFDLRTFQAPSTTFGFPAYDSGSSEVRNLFMDSVFRYAKQGHKDPKAAIIPVVQFLSGTSGPQYSTTLFYNGNDTSPDVFDDFLGATLQPIGNSTSLSPFSLAEYTQIISPAFSKGGQSYGINQRFHLLPIRANRNAMQVVHDTYFEAAQAAFNKSDGVTIGLAFNPITSKLLAASNTKPGALHGLDEEPSFWIEQTYSWKDPADDKLVENFIRTFNRMITKRLQSLNAMGSYYYLNEADKGQPVFESYPRGSLMRLKSIRHKYDPYRVFSNLMPGGWKVESAN